MSNQTKHWEKTRGLLFITLAIWFVFSIGIFLFGAEMNEVTGPFGYPWTYWFTCQGSLGIFVILIFSNLSSKLFLAVSMMSNGILFEISSSKILLNISFALLIS